MKIRIGFVSNSSSSSFVILLKALTNEQIHQIINHSFYGEQFNIEWARSDPWDITITDTTIDGWTTMDNFDMERFLREIDVPNEVIKWDQGLEWR